MFQSLTYGKELQLLTAEIEEQIKEVHAEIDKRIDHNQFRVLTSFQKEKVSGSETILQVWLHLFSKTEAPHQVL